MLKPDTLIRRIVKSDHIKNGQVHWRAFKSQERDSGTGLSVTKCLDLLQSKSDVDVYRETLTHPQGKLGVCFVDTQQVNEIELVVVEDQIPDEPYGKNHHLIQDEEAVDKCPAVHHSHLLAKYATDNGGAIPFEPNP